ncbi:MAG: hypothetical protein HY242_01400 [Afipia sp.]|nr:hypothetical protein [Afipia sp.]
MNRKTGIVLLLSFAALAEFSTAPAFARGGAANLMSSPGYQRRLQESRQQYLQATQPVVVVHPRHRYRHRHRH